MQDPVWTRLILWSSSTPRNVSVEAGVGVSGPRVTSCRPRPTPGLCLSSESLVLTAKCRSGEIETQ